MTTPIETFYVNFSDIEKLLEVHSMLTEGVQGRNKDKTVVLLRSAIVLTCACIETYFEDLALWGCEEISKKNFDINNMSKEMKKKISNQIRSDKNELAPLGLVGDGWKQIYKSIVSDMCDGRNGGFNTPKYKNVSHLVDMTFGIDDISQCWSWGGMYPELARTNLDKLVSLRGDIAHGKRVSGLNVQSIKTYSNLAYNIAEKTSAYVDNFIRSS